MRSVGTSITATAFAPITATYAYLPSRRKATAPCLLPTLIRLISFELRASTIDEQLDGGPGFSAPPVWRRTDTAWEELSDVVRYI